MDSLLQGKWWALLLRGILAIILGLILLANLSSSVMGVLIFIGYYLIIDGIIKLSQAYVQRASGINFRHTLIGGLVALALGVLVFAWPEMSAIVLIALVATHAIFQGVTDVYAVIKMRSEMKTGWFWWHVIAGIVQVIFGIWMIFQPLIGGLTVIIVIGIYLILLGIVLIVRSFQARSGGGLSSTATT